MNLLIYLLISYTHLLYPLPGTYLVHVPVPVPYYYYNISMRWILTILFFFFFFFFFFFLVEVMDGLVSGKQLCYETKGDY